MSDYRSPDSIAAELGQRFGLSPDQEKDVVDQLRETFGWLKDGLGRLPYDRVIGFAVNYAKEKWGVGQGREVEHE